MLINTRETYGLVAQCLHWATAILILFLLPLGVFMHELPASSAEEAAYKFWSYSLHKTVGMAAFLIAIVRVFWAIIQPHPKPLNGDKKLESLAAQTVHWTLYGAIILMPLTGWLHHSATEGFAPIWWPLPQDIPFIPKDAALSSLFGTAHVFVAILLAASLVLHIAGAMKHAVIDRDGTLARMIPGKVPDLPASLADAPFRRLPMLLALAAFLAVGFAVVTGNVTGDPNVSEARDGETLAGGGKDAWVVDPLNSELAIQIIQSGAPVTGTFGNWSASIDFDPDDLEAARVDVEVDIASLSLGAVTEQALSPDFLNAALFPTAVFTSDVFVKSGDGAYEARGTLTLAGKSNALTLPFTLKIEDDRAFVEGTVTIERLAFDIGAGGFSSDQMVGFDVVVTVVLEADRADPS